MPSPLYYFGFIRLKQYRILAVVTAKVSLLISSGDILSRMIPSYRLGPTFSLFIALIPVFMLTGCKTDNSLEWRKKVGSSPPVLSQLAEDGRPLFKQYLGNLSEKQRLDLFSDQQVIFEMQSKLCDQGKFGEARSALESLVARELEVLPAIHPLVAASRAKLLVVYSALHEKQKALATANEIVEAKERILGGGSPDTAEATVNLALLLAEQHKFGEAEEVLKSRLETIKTAGNSSSARVLIFYTLADIAQAQHRDGEASRLFREALLLKEAPESYSSRSLRPLASEIEARLK